MKKLFLILSIVLIVSASFGNQIRVAMQYGLGYAPIMLIKELNLLEKYAPDTKIEWMQLGSGAAINEALISGKVDIGSMGVGPFLIGIDRGAPWKMASALVSQPLGLQVNDENIKTLKDIKPGQKIALPAPGSIQHILLSMAAEKELGNPKALDSNIIAMAHPDGANALISKTSIVGHFTSPPYIFEELKAEGISQIIDAKDAFGGDFTFLVTVATQKFHDENIELYAAFVFAISEAINIINNNPNLASKTLAPLFGMDENKIYEYITWPGTNFSSAPYGIFGFAEFMKKAGYLRSVPKKFNEIGWENVNAIIGNTYGSEKSPMENSQSR